MHGWSMVERNIERISSLVADLLNYARERKPDFVAIDPNQLVSDVLETQRPKAEAQGTALETQFDSAVSSWLLDPHAMHQCLTNLVTNALDATAGIDGAWVRVSTHLTEEDQLEIRIQDSGPGIAPNLLDTLFSSMISTKGSKGTGLGLLVVNKIVMEHSGKVTAEAGMAPGATFRVFLPRCAGEAEVPSLGGQATGAQVAATGSDDAVSATGSRQVPFGLESSQTSSK
jgi:signal transduction histidine kinase